MTALLTAWFGHTFERPFAGLPSSFHHDAPGNVRLRKMAHADEEARAIYDDVASAIRRLYAWGKTIEAVPVDEQSRLSRFLLERLPDGPAGTLRTLREWDAYSTQPERAFRRNLGNRSSPPGRSDRSAATSGWSG